MSSISATLERATFRRELIARGGAAAARCYQCGTCSSVCDLAPDGAPFPRRQMLEAQWGLVDRLQSDPAVWLCHQCNDCSVRCPRDAQPGDVMQAVRALSIEKLAAPAAIGKLVGKASVTWPILLGAPILLWIVLLSATTGIGVPQMPALADIKGDGPGYHLFLHSPQIYSVMFPTMILVALAFWVSGNRFWKMLGEREPRSGSFFSSLIPVAMEILVHGRFKKCETAKPRRLGHLALMWGFIGATVTTSLVALALYVLGNPLPLSLTHPFKLLGNFSALLLLYGCTALAVNRLTDSKRTGTSTAFDNFFLMLVALVTVTGILTEVARLMHSDTTTLSGPFYVGCWFYIVHMGAVVSLFLTLPYSKFAHLVYRTLTMVHERMAAKPPA